MRMRGAASARARSSASDAILLTRTFVRPDLVSTKSGSTPNCVIVGPRLISTTCTGAPNDARVSCINLPRCSMNSSLTDGAEPKSRIFFTSGSCQWMIASIDLTVVTGMRGAEVFTAGSERCSGVYPFDATSASSGEIGSLLCPIGVASISRNFKTTGLTHLNKSLTEMSKIIVIVISSHASRATTAPQVPKLLNKARSMRLPMYPPPAPSMAACPAISGEAMIECMVASSHRKNRIIPVARSSERGGSFSMRRRISHKPIPISAIGRI